MPRTNANFVDVSPD
jgi:hypothetical protein